MAIPQPRKVKIPGEWNFAGQVAADDPAVRASSYWIEKIGNESPGSEEIATKFARAVIPVYVPDDANFFYDFINNVLGYSYLQDDGTLVRKNPIQHPRYPNLRAARITNGRGLQYESRKTSWDNATEGPTEYASYDRRLAFVEFQPPAFALYSDDDITTDDDVIQEWQRYTICDVDPKVYNVSIQTGTFKWAEGSAGNPNGKQFPGEVNFMEVKTSFNVIWKNVPEDFVLDVVNHTLMPYPTKIIAAAGRVNSAIFDGYPIGTLLMLEPKIDRYLSGTLIYNNVIRMPVMMCDVILPIIHFDPPVYGSFKGHNTKPWWNKADNTFLYHLVSTDGSSTTTGRIYGEYDYKKIFEHWAA